jgi:putative phosphonate metabolism protein
MTRYALYFAPAIDSPWWDAGCHWLGRDPSSGAARAQYPVPGVPGARLAALTANARRYGFHATLKPPFRLRDECPESQLLTMAQAFCATQTPVVPERPRVALLGDFLALRPSGSKEALGALAMRCVSYFDALRAAPAAAELEQRRRAGLTERQELLLRRWGYPYTEEKFRFHMTLTDALTDVDAAAAQAIRTAAERCFAAAAERAPLVIDGLTIFRERQPGAMFSVWRRIPFGTHCG